MHKERPVVDLLDDPLIGQIRAAITRAVAAEHTILNFEMEGGLRVALLVSLAALPDRSHIPEGILESLHATGIATLIVPHVEAAMFLDALEQGLGREACGFPQGSSGIALN